MKCPVCGYLSFDLLESCGKCGAPMVATAGAVWAGPEEPSRDPAGRGPGSGRPGSARRSTVVRWDWTTPEGTVDGHADPGAVAPEGEDFEAGVLERSVPADPQEDGPVFSLDGNLFGAEGPAAGGPETEELPGSIFSLPEQEPEFDPAEAPIIDSYEEVPEQFWAPEVAGFSRRGLALLVDQTLLAAILGLFFVSALFALRSAGVATEHVFAASGLQAALPPFALLAALVNLGYHAFFHGTTGCTPGKALAGIEVRTCDGGDLTWERVMLRWFCAALGLASAGAGLVWAVFEPRRRGWADLLSGTIIARRRRAAVDEASRR